MQEIPKQRPHFPRILDSRRRAQEQSNAGPSKKRREAPVTTPQTALAHDETPSAGHLDEQH